MKMAQHPAQPTASILLTGPPKRGKTNGAASAPGPVLYNNFDLPNATRLIHRRFGDTILEPELPPREDRKRNLFAHLMEINKMAQRAEVATVVADPIGELYRRLLEEFSNYAIRPSLPTYGEVTVQVERFCRGLCTAPVNTVLVCHEIMQENGDEVISIPFTGTKSGSPDLGAKLQSMVDIIAYASVLETPRAKEIWEPAASRDGNRLFVAQLIPGKGRTAGDRFDCLGAWRPLDIAEWLDTLTAYEKGEEIRQFDLGADVGTTEEIGSAEGEAEEPAEPETQPAEEMAA